MPVHNGERFLKEAIESVLKQSYTNFEFLIIENCSTDQSLGIIKSYEDPRIRIIKENDCGKVQAYNRGFKEAKGEYIFIHDQDDISHSQRFKKQLRTMLNKNIDICGSYYNIINVEGKILGKQMLPIIYDDIKDQLPFKNWVLFNSSLCIKKKIFYEYGFFDGEYYPSSDYEFYLRIKDKCKYSNIPEYLYNWRRNKNQISISLKKETINKSLNLSLKYLEMIRNKLEIQVYYFNKGLVYYYNNYLLKAFYFFLKSLTLSTNRPRKLIRYLFIVSLFGLPLKILRNTDIIYSPLFIFFKRLF